MDFRKSLFWICFIIITKITFTVFYLNPIQYDSAQYGPVICSNNPIEIISIKNSVHLHKENLFHTNIQREIKKLSLAKKCSRRGCMFFIPHLSIRKKNYNIVQLATFLKNCLNTINTFGVLRQIKTN